MKDLSLEAYIRWLEDVILFQSEARARDGQVLYVPTSRHRFLLLTPPGPRKDALPPLDTFRALELRHGVPAMPEGEVAFRQVCRVYDDGRTMLRATAALLAEHPLETDEEAYAYWEDLRKKANVQ